MLFPNPTKALTEMRRVVKLDGNVAVMVLSALEKNPYHGIVFGIVQRLGSIPPPAPGEPWMYGLGEPRALEGVYKAGGFLNASVHAVPIQWRFASTAEAIGRMKNSAGDLRELINRLNDADRELAWLEIEEQLRRLEGPDGLELSGEVLIGRRDEVILSAVKRGYFQLPISS
jgi:hypothetical protein